MKEVKWRNTNIGVGYIIKKNVGDMEEKTREGIRRRIRKKVVGCVQDVVEKKNFMFKLKYRRMIEMGSSLISYLCSKDEVRHKVNNTIYDLKKN